MRAVLLDRFGAPPTISELPVPRPVEGEVRVRVRAASVNGFDLAVANGYVKDLMEHRFPVVLGKDFAGTVDALGAGVSDYAVGDRVFGVVMKPYIGDGSFAEFVNVPTELGIAMLPAMVGYAEGGALGLAGTAAFDAVQAAAPKKGNVVLIVGATGGVGTQAVQMTANAGAYVIATAGTEEERGLMRSLGASEDVDPATNIVAQVRAKHPDGVDIVLHFAGDGARLVPLVRGHHGAFVSTLIESPAQLPRTEARVVPIYAQPTTATLDRLASNQASGETRVVIQRKYAFGEALAALKDFAKGTAGKLVIVID